MGAGVYPTEGHDGVGWERDEYRAALSGKPFKAPSMLLHIKADWAKLAHTFGFPQWSDCLRP